MITRICDRCGQPLEQGALRYVAKIQVFAAYDPLEITFEDLMRDHSDDIKKILEQCKDLTEEDLMRDVFVDFQFDLCHACQRTYIQDPLPAAPQERN
jgi:hypothetical protein